KIIITIISLCFFAIVLFSLSKDISLPTIGTIHKNALRKGNKSLKLDKQEYLSIPLSFLAFLVGLIDGDGYIQVTKTSKGFIAIKLVISLHLEDISTLEYIHSVLKIGKINIYKDLRSPTCKLVINKTDLQEILFPLLIYHKIFFLTITRMDQFNLAKYIMKNDIKLYSQIPNLNNIPAVFEIPENPIDYTLLHFFKNWIVGFACSEGSFFIKSNNDGCFQLRQRIHTNLFEAFKLIFNTNRKIDTTNNFNQFGVSSKSDIQKVINFFSFSGLHPLVGRRLIEYLSWVETLKVCSHGYKDKQILESSCSLSRYQVFFSLVCIVCLVLYYSSPEGVLNYVYMSTTLPIVSYINLDIDKVIAIKSNRKLSGVYRWTHKKSGKSYIGSSVDLGQRFSSYFSLIWISSQAKSSIICKALIKYGYSEFSLEILEYCNKEDTIKREQFYLDNLKPEYNILKIAGSRLGFEQSLETKVKISSTLTGRILSESTKNKIKESRVGIAHSDATKAKLIEHLTNLNKSILANKKSIKVTILDLETNITTEYYSIRKAAQAIGSYAHVLTKHENLQLDKGYTKPFKDRYVIKINR
uniref:hypothetical protein n=1 Tax=Diaporthe sojae TaxID=165439 RepID=UPI0024100973